MANFRVPTDPSASGAEGTEVSTRQRTLAWGLALAILFAAGCYSLGPLLVEVSSSENNPFAFNTAMRIGEIAALALYLVLTARRTFGSSDNIRRALAAGTLSGFDGPTHLSNMLRVSYHSFKSRSFRSYLHSPMFWIIITNPTYAFLAWASAYVDTAVAAIVIETWPMIMIFSIASLGGYDALGNRVEPYVDKTKAFLVALAPLGIALVILGQTNGFESSPTVSLSNVFAGVCLALIAAAMAGISPVATIRYGHDKLSLMSANALPLDPDASHQLRRTTRWKISWFSVLGLLIADVIHIPIGLVLSATSLGGIGTISSSLLSGGLLAGAMFGIGGVLLRAANSTDNDPNRNSILYLTPILSLLWLFIHGVEIPRTDLFLIGAALIVSVIVIVQNDPDQERNLEEYSEKPARGIRLSFVSLVLSLWLFGTIILLRDDSFLEEYISWHGGDYWTLVALSATVFALIFGFRTTRIANRISREEEAMLRLFRECQLLAYEGKLNPSILKDLRRLYRAGPKAIESAYDEVRNQLLHDSLLKSGTVDHAKLFDLQSNLDVLTHSKQRGREFVELISLAFLATVTIVLGVGSRPDGIHLSEMTPDDVLWTGFISEVFAILFLSTIMFLWTSLFDLHRDRELPLISVLDSDRQERVQESGATAEDLEVQSPRRSGIFFRHEEDLVFQRFISVMISLGMCIVFVVLLFDKWF